MKVKVSEIPSRETERPIRPALSTNRFSSNPSSKTLLSTFSSLPTPDNVSNTSRDETSASENCNRNCGRPSAVNFIAANPLSDAPPAAITMLK